VTDVGTEFGVEVSKEGNTTSHVFRGTVEVEMLGGRGRPEDALRLVHQNESVCVAGEEGERRIVVLPPARADGFVRTMSRTDKHTASTIAYWRFEEGTVASKVPGQGMMGRHNTSYVRDSSGNGNHLRTLDESTAPTYRNDVASSAIPQIGEANHGSLEFGKELGGAPKYLCSYDDSSFEKSLNYHEFREWTIEASVRLTSLTDWYQTFVCRERYGSAGRACLYLQATPKHLVPVAGSSVFSVRALQADEKFVILNGVTPLVAGVWYNIAAVCDGQVLSLYLFDKHTGLYRLEGSTPFHGPMHTGNRFWLVGQGQASIPLADQTFGLIDEVRVSDKALNPRKFLFSAKEVAAEATKHLPMRREK